MWGSAARGVELKNMCNCQRWQNSLEYRLWSNVCHTADSKQWALFGVMGSNCQQVPSTFGRNGLIIIIPWVFQKSPSYQQNPIHRPVSLHPVHHSCAPQWWACHHHPEIIYFPALSDLRICPGDSSEKALIDFMWYSPYHAVTNH